MDLLSDSGFPPANFVVAMLAWGFSHNKAIKSFYALIELLTPEYFCCLFPQRI